MRSPKCLFSASAALYRVFIQPIERDIPQYLHRGSRQNIFPLRSCLLKPFAIQSRSYATAKASPVPTQRRLPRNSEIRNFLVNVIDEYGVFHEAAPTREVLSTINLQTHSLVVVTAPPDDYNLPAIAKVVTRAQLADMAVREKELAKEAKKKNPNKITKMLELNWAIDNNDLGHRILKIKEFLGKGNRVEIVISPKRRGKKIEVEKRDYLVERLREVVQGEEGKIAGWDEWKEMEGDIDPAPPEEGQPVVARNKIGVVKLYFQGKVDAEEMARQNIGEGNMGREIAAQEEKWSEPKGEEEKTKEKEKKKKEKDIAKDLTAAQLRKREKWRKKERGEL